MSNQLNLPQVETKQVVETSRINGNRMHLSFIQSLIAKGLNTYVIKVHYHSKAWGHLEMSLFLKEKHILCPLK
jgi:hypothetical protein